ncbi:MAG: competence protein ComEC [Myxococcota bacterium]
MNRPVIVLFVMAAGCASSDSRDYYDDPPAPQAETRATPAAVPTVPEEPAWVRAETATPTTPMDPKPYVPIAPKRTDVPPAPAIVTDKVQKQDGLYPVVRLKNPASMAVKNPDTTMRVHFVDVGQGQAVLVEFPCGAALIDTGGESDDYHKFYGDKELTRYLEAFFARRKDLNNTIDLMVLTHPHKDHSRGAESFFTKSPFAFKNIVTNGQETGSGLEGQLAAHVYAGDRKDVKLRKVTTDDVYNGGVTDAVIDPIACKTGDPTIHALWGEVPFNPGWNKGAFRNENNHSVVLRIIYGKTSVIFMGDMEREGIEEFLRTHGPEDLRSDVWQISHHGADNGTTEPLAYTIEPQIAVLPMGNSRRKSAFSAYRHGHPRTTAIERILPYVSRRRSPVTVPMAAGSKRFNDTPLSKAIYGTGWGGSILVDFEWNGRITVLNEPVPKIALTAF